MPATSAAKCAAFHQLHESGCFVLPNPWDVGSAIALQSLGFKALASTSAGMAWSMGRPDNKVNLGVVLSHLKMLAGSVDVPINADFENAFAHDPAGVVANVSMAVETASPVCRWRIPLETRALRSMNSRWRSSA